MNFQRLLLRAEQNLRKDDVPALVFLCKDLCCSTEVKTAKELFSLLCDQDHLSEQRLDLLSELLMIIKCRRLLRDLGLNICKPTNFISAYRKLLYRLSEELTQKHLNDIKFLLKGQLSGKQIDDSNTTLEVFLELERMELLSETKLDLLEKVIEDVCPVLVEQIHQFKAQNSASGRLAVEETGQQKVQPSYLQINQAPLNQPGSAEEAEITAPLQELQLGSGNNSPNPTSAFNDEDEPEAGPSGLTGSHTETSSCESTKGRSDAVVSVPEENQTSRTEASVTSKANAGLKTYSMKTLPRGCCCIINNYDFGKSRLPKREGTQVDKVCLETVFRWLGFDVEVHQDCTSNQMLSLMEELAGKSKQQWDCVVCCVLSHGLEDCVHGVDGNTVNIKMLLEPFTGTKCPSMAGKPKLFFIQACQGKKKQGVVYLDGDRPEHNDVDTDAVTVKQSIPSDADFLLGMATVPEFVSYREKKGTWYIQSLCQNLVDMVPSGADLMSILTKVNADVGNNCDRSGTKKQMPQPAFTLTKEIVFPVPSGPGPDLSKIKDSLCHKSG